MKRVDESMNLLYVLRDTALEPDYATVSHSYRQRRYRLGTLLATLIAGILIAISANLITGISPQNKQERGDLIKRIQHAEQQQDTSRKQLSELETHIKKLSESRLLDPQIKGKLGESELLSGAVPVVGPGLRIVVGDADKAVETSQRVTDRDLRQLVNGLKEAGAEAIAISGHRLSSRTAIRGAGSAITVDYVSLTSPYTVDAIGDPLHLAADFANTTSAGWWNYLHSNFGIRYESVRLEQIKLPADPGLSLIKVARTT